MADKEISPGYELKKDLVLADYNCRRDSYHLAGNSIDSLRQWELGLVSAVLGYALAQNISRATVYLLVTILVQFAVLEALARGRMILIGVGLIELERLFSTSDHDAFFENYVFGFARWGNFTLGRKARAAAQAILAPAFLSWHLSLATTLVVLFVLLW